MTSETEESAAADGPAQQNAGMKTATKNDLAEGQANGPSVDTRGSGQQYRYTPKNILVTGGAGFIASHVVILLVERYPQYNVVNFDRLDYCSCLENLDSIKGRTNYKVSLILHYLRLRIFSAGLLVNSDKPQ